MKVFQHTTWDFEECSFCPTLTNVAATQNQRVSFEKKKHVWWGTILISWIQKTMLVWSNWTYITFLNIRPFLDQNSPRPFLSSAQKGVVFGYTLRVSEASTAKVSSRGGAAAGCSLLGLEAQVTERKPKITRSAATSVHHVLRFVDAFKGFFSPSFRMTESEPSVIQNNWKSVLFLGGQKMCTFWNKEWEDVKRNLVQYRKAL